MAIAHGNIAGLLRKHGCTEIRKVGEGSFGKAILVQDETGNRLICKMVDISKASRKEMQDAVAEGKLLAQLRHPYIVRYRENFTDNGWFCILMDFAEGGDLTKRIEQAKKGRTNLPEDQILKWFTQMVLALQYLHDKHILHRDLKPANLFLSKNGSMKMGDFGIAKVLDCTLAVARTQIGTPYYLSPELCQEKPYAWPSDIWAMGCIVYELCALRVPFDAPNISGLVQKICRGPVPTVPSPYSGFLREVAGQMLNRNADRRPGCDDLLNRAEIQVVVQQLKDEDQDSNESDDLVAPRGPRANSQPASERGGHAAGPYHSFAGTYSRNDLVEYNSSAHKSWLPATVINVDGEGGIIIDLKPNTWIHRSEQALKVRPRSNRAEAAVVGAVGRQCSTPMRQRSPSVQRPPSQRASPMHSPFMREAPPSRGAAPMIRRSPSMGAADRPGSRAGGGGAAPVWGMYKKSDLVEFYSNSHKDWLPATIINVDYEGRITIDLKPNTWISRDEQSTRVRPRKSAAGLNSRPGSRCASPMMRSPSAGGFDRGLRGNTPSRQPSPRRVPSRGPPSRAESPRAGYGGAGAGTPRIRPPGLRPGISRVSDSPLRAGGRNIAGI